MTALAKKAELADVNEKAPALSLKRLEKLRFLQTPKPFVFTILPELAQKMLEYNRDRQRNTRSNKIIQFGREIDRNNWVVMAQGISFDREGYLFDGQHRLEACVLSRTPLEILVMFGCDPRAFMKVDCGSARTAADVLHMMGVSHATNMASATRWIKAYELGNIRQRSPASGLSGTATGEGTSNEDIYDWFLENPDLPDRKNQLQLFRRSGIASPSMALAFFTLFARKDFEQAQTYIHKVFAGVGIESTQDPAHVVRQTLIVNKSDRRLRVAEAACFLVKGWNATRREERISHLRWLGRESFPEIV